MVWSKFRQCEQNFQECDQHLDGVNKIMTVWFWKLMVWTNFVRCDQTLDGVIKIMTVWYWKLMVWSKFLRCDQMLMVWWNDISVWWNVHFLEIVWSHRMVWSMHMFFPDVVDVAACGNRSMRIQDWYVGTFPQFIEIACYTSGGPPCCVSCMTVFFLDPPGKKKTVL